MASWNIRSGDGAGAGMGFRGGKGKPGYPVPDDQRNEIEPQPSDQLETGVNDQDSRKGVFETAIENIVAKVTTVAGLVETGEPTDVVKKSNPLDLVVWNAVNGMLGEGGAAVGGDRIPREHVVSTIESFKKNVLSKIKHKSVKPIGSTGKKISSGDLDLGLDTDLTLDQVAEIVKGAGLEFKANKGLGEVSIKFPQVDQDGKETGLHAQIDLMIGPEAWTQFQYYGPGDASKYTGVHVRGIVNAIVSIITGHSVSPARGFFRKDDPNKKYLQDPQHAVDLISKNSSEPWTVQDLTQPFEKIWEKTKRSFTPEELAKIKEYFLGFMKSTKQAVPSELGEAAETPKDLPKGIAHLEDMKPDEFMRFLTQYKDLPLKGGLEVSEKVDGSARVSFGINNGKIWTQSKNGPKKTDASQYPDRPMFQALKTGHEALASKESEIAKAWPKDIAFLVAEVLYTKIPNSIEYGPNVIMVHGVHKMDGSVVPEAEGKKIVDGITSAAGGKLNDGKDDWKFEYKRVVNPQDVMVDVKEEFASISDIYNELKKLEPNKLKAVGKGPYKAAAEKFKAIQIALKRKLIGQLRKQRSSYGPEGGDVEGLVFRDLETGGMTKLVDKDYFTKLNNFLWHYRKMLDAGVKVGDKWEFGIMQKFRNAIADNVIGSPAAKMQSFVSTLKKFGADLKYPEAANTPEKKADYLLSQYIKKNDLMKGDFMAGFQKELQSVKAEFDKLKAEWDTKKKQELTHQVKDEDGNVVKTVKMDPLIKSRTDDSFKGMEDFFAGVSGGIDYAQKMRGDLTKKTALMKLMMGPGRFDKLQGDGEEEPTEESVQMLEGPTSYKDPDEVLSAFKEKLANRKIDVSHAKELGSGHNGTAYEVAGGKVLKITQDPYEAKASNHLIGKKLKHVVRIFDVFRFPGKQILKGRGALPWYGIFQEKVDEMPEHDKTEFEHARLFVTRHFADLKNFSTVDNMWVTPWEEIKTRVMNNSEEMEEVPDAKEAIDTLERLGLPEVLDELKKNQIGYRDVHVGNFMRRGKDMVVIDLGGASKSPGGEPPILEMVIEGVLEGLSEARADQVGVTIGRFQPFHKGHAAMIRDLAKKFNKVIVIVAGNSQDKKNPFSYDLRLDMMKKSMPDIMSKLEIYKAQMDGKNSGYIPGVLSDIIKNNSTSIDGGAAFQILVGQDRLQDVQKQIEHAKKAKEQGTESNFDPNLATVGAISDVKNDDDVDRVSGTRVRDAIVQDQRDVVKSLLDPHLVSNPADFEEIYAELKKQLGAQPVTTTKKPVKVKPSPTEMVESVIDEVIGDIGGEPGVKEILASNKDRLAKSKWHINVDQLHRLGGGLEGIAYDIGHSRVLKVTADEAEATTSYGLMNKTNLPNVVKIFDVFAFPVLASNAPDIASPKAGQESKHPAYGIVTEKLTSLSDAEGKEFDEATDWLVGGAKTAGGTEVGHIPPDVKNKVRPLVRRGDWDGAMKVLGEVLLTDTMSEVGTTDRNNPRVQRASQKRFQDLVSTFQKFNLPGIVKDLRTAKVEFSDFHSGNLMKRGSQYVINDLGRSESPTKARPPKLGEIVGNVMEQLMLEFGMSTTGTGQSAGSSAFSSFKNPIDPDGEDQWQTQLSRLEIFGSGALPEAAEQGELGLTGIDKSKHEPIKENAWNPWTSSTDTVPFDAPKTGVGRGEKKLAAELEIRGKKVQMTGAGTTSYDILVDSHKWEVKEYGQIRIEATGQAAAQKALSFFVGFADALKESLDEIDQSGQKLGELLKVHGMSEDEFREFVKVAQPSATKGNIPLGLVGFTLAGESKFPSDFSKIAKTIHSLIKSSQSEKQRVKLSVGSGENAEQVNVLDQDMDASDLRYLLKIVGKLSGDAKTKIMSNVASHIFISNFKLSKINVADISENGVKENFLRAFDPSIILGDIDKIAIVDATKGYFVIDPKNFLEYMRPNGISKSTQSFVPRPEKMGAKAPPPKTMTRKEKQPTVQREPTSAQKSLFTNKNGAEIPNPKLAKKAGK